MMIDDFEDKALTDLLADYAAPMQDNGFSARISAQLSTPLITAPRAHMRERAAFLAGGACVGAIVSAPAWGKIGALLASVNTPDLSALQSSALSAPQTTLTLITAGLILAIVFMRPVFADQI